MPTGQRIRGNNAFGVTTDNPLAAAATTFNSSQLQLLPAVTTGHAIIVFDPKRKIAAHTPEIVVVTSHVGSGTTATIQRAAYGTVNQDWPVGTEWAHVTINEDYVRITDSLTRPTDPYEGQIIYEMDTRSFRQYYGGTGGWNSQPPVGTLLAFLGSVAPEGYLMANGAAVSRTGVTAALFAVIGTTYGVGNGIDTYNLPNLNGKVPVGRDATQAEFDVLGESGGAKTVTITQAQMPVHAHGITDVSHGHAQTPHGHGVNDPGHGHGLNWNDPGHRHGIAGDTGFRFAFSHGGAANGLAAGAPERATFSNMDIAYTGITASIQGNGTGIWLSTANANLSSSGTGITGTNNAGSGESVTNLQPYIVVNYIIKI